MAITCYFPAMHVVAILALEGVVPFDLATPCDVFGRVRLRSGLPAYDVRVCAPGRTVDAGAFVVRTRFGLGQLAHADTIILPGVSDALAPVPASVLRALRAAAARGARIASLCSGAFVLAATGLLDGLRATTHWLGATELARRHPRIEVDAEVLYVDNGALLTSAGAAAGLDLCLHMIRRDHGAAVAANAARFSVMALERSGGQAQFIAHEPPGPEGASLEATQRWLEQHLDEELSLPDIARRARMSSRTLHRRFREQTGTTPLQWLLRARVRRAQHLLETTAHSVEKVAAAVGFGSTAAYRDRFRRIVGVSPQAYRLAFRAPSSGR